jgi:hypothetical protein
MRKLKRRTRTGRRRSRQFRAEGTYPIGGSHRAHQFGASFFFKYLLYLIKIGTLLNVVVMIKIINIHIKKLNAMYEIENF